MQNHSFYWCFIIFLTWSVVACKGTSSDLSADNEVIVSENVDNGVQTLTIQPALAVVWIDQLRVRTHPTLESSVVAELKAGDTLYYLYERTVHQDMIILRDSTFRRPWLKVNTKAGQTGWVFGGGVIMN